MAKFENKDGFKNITEVRNFLSGLNNRKNSKVYLNIEQQDGYNYLCIWLDNKLDPDQIVGDKAYLDSINGFKKHYQLRMNKVEENIFLMETVQDISTIAWPEIMAFNEEDGCDSRETFAMFREWAREFEKMWNTYVEQGVEDDHDYMLEVEEFTEKKVAEYKETYS